VNPEHFEVKMLSLIQQFDYLHFGHTCFQADIALLDMHTSKFDLFTYKNMLKIKILRKQTAISHRNQ